MWCHGSRHFIRERRWIFSPDLPKIWTSWWTWSVHPCRFIHGHWRIDLLTKAKVERIGGRSDERMNGEIFENSNTNNDLTLSSVDLLSSPNGSIDDIIWYWSPDFLPPGKSLNAAAFSFVFTFCSHSYQVVRVHFPPLVVLCHCHVPNFELLFKFSPTGLINKRWARLFQGGVERTVQSLRWTCQALGIFSTGITAPRKSRTREIVDRLRSTTSLDDSITTA